MPDTVKCSRFSTGNAFPEETAALTAFTTACEEIVAPETASTRLPSSFPVFCPASAADSFRGRDLPINWSRNAWLVPTSDPIPGVSEEASTSMEEIFSSSSRVKLTFKMDLLKPSALPDKAVPASAPLEAAAFPEPAVCL